MIYTDFTVGNETYKLRLNTRAVVELEKKLGTNPIGIFGNGDSIPTVSDMVSILHASLQQYNHGISLSDAYNIFDKYVEDGHAQTDFIQVIIDIYKCSGIIPEDVTEKN